MSERAESVMLDRQPHLVDAVEVLVFYRMDWCEEGMKLYNLGERKAALEEFKQAYLIKSAPALSFDIIKCQLARYERVGNSRHAFLREPQDGSERQREQMSGLVVQVEQAAYGVIAG